MRAIEGLLGPSKESDQGARKLTKIRTSVDHGSKRFTREADRHGFRVAILPNPDKTFSFPESDDEIKLPMSPLQWYGLLRDCAGFVGIRFHALVSCLANGTPVLSVDSPARFDPSYRFRSKTWGMCNRAGGRGQYCRQADVIEETR
jgi:hypothetical protein